MKSALNNISTVIFDLGGVIINIDPQQSVERFSAYSGVAPKEVFKRFVESEWTYAFEKGEITEADFRNEVRKSLHTAMPDKQIDAAWNAMLLDIPPARLHLANSLRQHYEVIVLSNTNAIHVKQFDSVVATTVEGARINDFFDHVYYSNEVGMRKPDAEIFTFVLEKHGLVPEKTLFIDDMAMNIEAAQELGIRTVHLTDPEHLFDFLPHG